MTKDVTPYFDETVIPVIEDRHPVVASAMAIQVRGSYGLGVADEYSDLDAVLWLDDPIWKEEGGRVQLTLENEIPGFVPRSVRSECGHPEVSVWPLSWLGDRRRFLSDAPDMPWERVAMEDLFEIQNNLVLRDPRGLFRRLKEATQPGNYPPALWRKRLIQDMKKLDEDIAEYRQVIRRNQRMGATIIDGRLAQEVLHLGFLASREYYPWRPHLHWAFSRLPAPASELSPHLHTLSGSGGHDEKLSAVQAARGICASTILDRGLLSAEVLGDLVWAERLEAWSNPSWRDWVKDCQGKAEAAGYQAKDFWIWSLWGRK